MVASASPFGHTPDLNALHVAFMALLPRVQTHARIAFRHVRCPAQREDIVQEVCALAWKWFLRLHERGKDLAAFETTFATLVARAVRSGRRVCGQEPARDVLSPTAQQRHAFRVEALPASTNTAREHLYGAVHGQREHDAFEERLQDNTVTPVPDQAAFRVDWPEFIRTLARRDRAIAAFLSLGHSAVGAAERFRLSPGRVTQLRQGWCRAWQRCQAAESVGA